MTDMHIWGDGDGHSEVQLRRALCDFCDNGWVDGPYIAPDVTRAVPCPSCDGDGWVESEFHLIDLDDITDQ